MARRFVTGLRRFVYSLLLSEAIAIVVWGCAWLMALIPGVSLWLGPLPSLGWLFALTPIAVSIVVSLLSDATERTNQ